MYNLINNMKRTADQIYAANVASREKLIAFVQEIDAERAVQKADGEGWTIAQVLEHISIVESGIIRICAKLLAKAEASGEMSDGTITLSDEFLKKAGEIDAVKLEAPQVVHPESDITLAQALDHLASNREMLNELHPKFLEFRADVGSFPHPYIGDMTAGEWLSLIGGHDARHLKQIERINSKL